MIIGASSFAGPLEELKGNVDSIELYIPKLGVYDGLVLEKDKLDRILDEISVYEFESTIHAPYFAADPKYPPVLRLDTAKMGRREFALMEESITLANRIGARVVVMHPGRVGQDRENSFSSMVENLGLLASTAEDYGVMLGLENKEGTDPLNLCCEAEELCRAVEAVNSGNLKVTFDIGHANLTCGGDPEKLKRFVRLIREHIVHLHLHDNGGQWTEKYDGDEHMAPGKGCVDFSALKLLSGYRGVYNLEVFSLEDVRLGKNILENALKP
ncbi:sugar phosphate isomerase/epimerase [Methanosarcina sp. KYL-1]|uniref:sugar phosphate isomerase/epimerase family protein n=1 Tax=Methanosarcina sp. KYL-1 TaxID=2602068 RepID=UPI0021013284|nr:sugar phosphate isomerase/epimerase [Methanosarcina sp. KYL-1]